jgi:hypothetical protein
MTLNLNETLLYLRNLLFIRMNGGCKDGCLLGCCVV